MRADPAAGDALADRRPGRPAGRSRGLKLRTHFALLVLATLVPVLVLAGSMILLVQRQQRASVEEGLRATVRAVAGVVEREFEASFRALDTLGASDALDRRDLAAFYQHARRARQANPRWLTVFLIDADGTQLLSLLRPLGTPLPQPEPWGDVSSVLRTGQRRVSDVFVGPLSGRQVIVILVPVARGGVVRYALGISMTTDALATLLSEQTRSPRSVAVILDRAGTVVARSSGPDHPAVEVAMPDAVERARREGEAFGVVGEGRRSLQIAYGRVPACGCVVGMGHPVRVAAHAVMTVPWLVALGSAGILAAALVLSIGLGRRIARPMRALTAAATRLADAEPLPDEPPSGVTEIDVVRAAMARAATAVHEREAERERRVAADTARAAAETRTRVLERESREKDEFLAMLGHELRNPLGAIQSGIAVLQRARDDEKVSQRAREIITRQIAHLVGIVDDLLDIGRVTTGKVVLNRRPVELAVVVRRALDTLEASGRTSRHAVTCDARPVLVDGDETRVEQVFNNLLGNALKYTPAAGRIHVAVERDGDDAVLRVQDTGIGIPPDRLPFVFDLFFQGERGLARSDGGLGIGLTLVKRLVELHGGTVAAESDGPGRGATFVVRLPAIATTPAPAPAPARDAGPPRRILLVEDNDDAREMMEEQLRLTGHDVYAAALGEVAVRIAETVDLDIALVDIGLPDVDGYAVAERLRKLPRGRDLLLIAITGYGQPEDRARAGAAGFDAHVAKPVTLDALHDLIAARRTRV